MHVSLVVGMWMLSLAALQPIAAAFAAGAGAVLAVELAAMGAATILFSDFFSGIFHWSADNYGNGKTPVFGSVIEAFQGHHGNPWTITYRSFFNNVHKIAKAAIPLLLIVMALSTAPGVRLCWVLFLNSQILSQEFHKLSHTVNPPAYVRWLQNRNIILSRKEHGLHHSSPFEAKYWILTGTCNEALDRFHVWRRLEAFVYRVNGVEPNCWKEDEGGELKTFALGL